jgi:hypothetical protein
VSPAVEIAQGEEGRLLIRWFISTLWHPKPGPLGR